MTYRKPSVREEANRQWLAAITLGVLGALAVLAMNDSPFLPAVHADSVEYMEAGKALVNGDGLSIPITSWSTPDTVGVLAHFPPGMSIAIGGVMKATGVRTHVAALWVLSLAAGMSLGLAFLVGYHVAGWGAGLLSSCLIAVSPPFVLSHTAVWSEPLYVSMLLATLLLMLRQPDRPWLSGLAATGAVLIRYLGVATIGAVGIWALWRTRSLVKSLVAVAPGTVAFVGWSLWTRGAGGTVRTVGEFSVGIWSTLAQVPGALQFWLAPGLPIVVGFFLVAIVVVAAIKAPRALAQPALLLAGMHITVILLSRLTVDQRIPLDERMLMPVFILLMVPAAVTIARLRLVAVAAALAWMVFAGSEDYQGVRSLQASGSYYSSAAWLTSDLMYWVDDRATEYRLYSNEPGLLYFLASRHAKTLPLKSHDFEAFVEKWNDAPGAIIVAAPMRQDEVAPGVYLERLPLVVVHSDEMGVILVPKALPAVDILTGGVSEER